MSYLVESIDGRKTVHIRIVIGRERLGEETKYLIHHINKNSVE